MKHFTKYLLFWSVIIGACSGGDDEVTVDAGLDYFPLRTGFYQIYQINEIRYSQVVEPDTLAYELMSAVVDSFQNAAGNTTYVIHRSKRESEDEEWEFIETWSARLDNSDAVHVEGNISYVKLTFPLKKGRVWNGNKLNALEADEYEVKEFDQPFMVDGTTFEKTLTVEQELNDDPIVFTDLRTEVYARNAGLIYKETTQLRYCQQQNCSGNELIDEGLIFKQQIREYGIR